MLAYDRAPPVGNNDDGINHEGYLSDLRMLLFAEVDAQNIGATSRRVDDPCQSRLDTSGDTTEDTAGKSIRVKVDDIVDPGVWNDVVEEGDKSDINQSRDSEGLTDFEEGKNQKRNIEDKVENRSDGFFVCFDVGEDFNESDDGL